MIFNSIIGDKTTFQKLLHSPELLKAKQTEARSMILKQLKKNRKLVNKEDQHCQSAYDEYKWLRVCTFIKINGNVLIAKF